MTRKGQVEQFRSGSSDHAASSFWMASSLRRSLSLGQPLRGGAVDLEEEPLVDLVDDEPWDLRLVGAEGLRRESAPRSSATADRCLETPLDKKSHS